MLAFAEQFINVFTLRSYILTYSGYFNREIPLTIIRRGS